MITWLLHDLMLLIGSVLIQITTESGEFIKVLYRKHPKTVVFKHCFSVRIASARSYISCMIPVCWHLSQIDLPALPFFLSLPFSICYKARFLEQIILSTVSFFGPKCLPGLFFVSYFCLLIVKIRHVWVAGFDIILESLFVFGF